MNNIIKIYNDFKIPPNLQLHQLRVAAVANLISDNMNIKVDTKEIISADLLHDMGNIIKFNFELFPEFLEPEGKDYWQSVKDEFIQKYGDDEHIATHIIAKELCISDRAFQILFAIGFSKSPQNASHSDFSIKIATYADNRVTPHGISSMEERIDDGRKRFKAQKNRKEEEKNNFEIYSEAMKDIENQIFKNCRIKKEGITNDAVLPYIENLKNFNFNNNN